MAGIESLKELLKFLITASIKVATADANENGRIDWMESLGIITSLGFKIPGLINHLSDIKAEWKDLSPDECRELAKYLAEEFDMPADDHEKLEALVKRIATGLVDNYELYRDIQDILA